MQKSFLYECSISKVASFYRWGEIEGLWREPSEKLEVRYSTDGCNVVEDILEGRVEVGLHCYGTSVL